MAETESKPKPTPMEREVSGDSADSDAPRKVSFANQARISTGSKDEADVQVPTKTANSKRSTTDTYSEASSATSGGSGDIYEVIEYDPTANVRASQLLGGLDVTQEEDSEYMGELDIGENTPAAEALRASAAVRVSRVGKAARAVNIQAVRKLVKRATGTNKHGVVKGKPPRLPGMEEWSEEEEEEDEEQINETHVHQPHQPSPHGQSNIPKDHMPDDVVAGTAEAGKKVLGNVDPHDVLKVLRWRKKKRGKESAPKSYVKGKVIDGEHELYTLSIAVMIGVRTSISKTNLVLNSGPSKRWVLPQDYRTTEKYEFRPKGGTGMPAHQLAHTFKFKDYAPVVFAYLRRLSGINEYDFLISVCGNANFIEFISNAKSGQFFFYSSDGRYMIKTMTNAESKFLRRILPDYFKHCCENPNTMITRFFGMYRVKLYHLRRNVKFVIMNSVYYTDKYLQTFYDLKGSVVGRESKPGQAVLKDNNLRAVLPQEALALQPETKKRVREQLDKDTKFMDEMGIMDYSMLVGIHHVPPAADKSIARTGFRSSMRKSKRRSVPSFEHMGALDHETPASSRRSTMNTPRQNSQPSFAKSDPTPLSSRRHLAEEIGDLAFDDDLDDDESSYLKGSEKRPKEITRVHEEMEQKKQATIEKLYWPFHHLFDIHGHRRLTQAKCNNCGETPCVCVPDENLQGYSVQKFQPPLSDRKDGGLEMDTTGLSLPMIYKGANGEQLYEGKIFYMGIIDILQEYNSRKMVEAQYRMFQASGKTEASCVDPRTYGLRFLHFFDEFTSRREPEETEGGVEMTLSLHESRSKAGEEGEPSTPENKQSVVDPSAAAAIPAEPESPGKTPAAEEEEEAALPSNPSKDSSAVTPPRETEKDESAKKDAETKKDESGAADVKSSAKAKPPSETKEATKSPGRAKKSAKKAEKEAKSPKRSPRRRLFGRGKHNDE